MSINRRDFLQNTSSAAAAMLLSPFDTIVLPGKPAFASNADFRLLIMNTSWGYKGDWHQFCAATKKEGYDGIEVWFPDDANVQQELFTAIKNNGLQVGFLCAGSEPDPVVHLQTFKKKLDLIVSNKYQKPVYINCHSGKDYFTYEQNKLLIDHTTQVSRQSGLPVYHETHRSRMLFAAPITRNFIEKNPELRLTLDISHWCNVHESLLNDQQQTVDIALSRVEHIHARIGHAEGPQVNDPRAPEWENAVKAHIAWWDKVIERKKQKGEQMTMLTEFGPPDYMSTLPYTRQPLADQWAINVHMMKLLRSRYQ
jgi:sugar phosphate isomerase/epimerase